MITAALLSALAMLDILMCGFRAAAGRDGRIDKRGYNLVAYARAIVYALGVIAFSSLLAYAVVESAPDPDLAWRQLLSAGNVATAVFGSFAAVTILALLLWASPVPEVRVLATVTVLGPLTLIRPLVIAGGLVGAALASPHPRVWVVAAAGAIATLAAEPMLGMWLTRTTSRRPARPSPRTPS